jgi:hypothetical protein
VLYRRTGASDFIIGNQITSVISVAVSIDDLSVGESYQFAARGISFSGALSPVSSLLSQTAPSNTTPPSTLTGLTRIAGDQADKGAVVHLGNEYYTAVVTWTKPSDRDIANYQWVITTINTDAEADAIIASGGGFLTREEYAQAVIGTPAVQYFRVRSINRSGTAGAWAAAGDLFNFYARQLGDAATLDTGTTAGTVAEGNDSRITGSAQKASNLSDVASPSAARANLGINRFSHVQSLTGGSPTETFTFTHSLGTVQDYVLAACVSPVHELLIAHDYSAAGNNSNDTVFQVATVDGSNIGAGLRRFTIHFVQ